MQVGVVGLNENVNLESVYPVSECPIPRPHQIYKDASVYIGTVDNSTHKDNGHLLEEHEKTSIFGSRPYAEL